MSLRDLPIPPRPVEFSPFGAPPGVACDFTAFKAFNRNGETTGDPWWHTRARITPRLALVHTNGARKEGKLASQANWANAGPSNTHPHYSVNAPQPTKFVPSDRKGIGNYKVADWSIVVETADAGWPTPGDDGGFLYDHAEIVARIIAYESIVADLLGSSMPITYPDRWDGAGVGCHTEPFGYPYWTNVAGKPCPGRTKKRQVRDEVMPRARQIRAAWLGTPKPDPLPPEDDMEPFLWRHTSYANVWYIEAANAITVDEATRDRAVKAGVKLYESGHTQMLQSCVAKAGLAFDDLVPVKA